MSGDVTAREAVSRRAAATCDHATLCVHVTVEERDALLAELEAAEASLAEAEEAPCWLTREEVGLAIDGVAMLVQPESGDEYRPLLRKLQAAYRASRKEQSE